MYDLLLQGFSNLNLTAGEAVAILHKVEHHLGWEISQEELKQGQLHELLTAEDYTLPLPSKVSFTLAIHNSVICFSQSFLWLSNPDSALSDAHFSTVTWSFHVQSILY